MRVALTSLCAGLAIAGCRFEGSADLDGPDQDDNEPEPAGPPTLFDLQQGLVAEGDTISVADVIVTAVAPEGLFVQEREGGPFSGVFVYLGAHPDWHASWGDLFAPGDVVTVTGIASEYAEEMDQFAIPTVTEIVALAADVVVTGHEDPPAPEPLTPFELFADGEAWEGVLVQVVQPFVLDHDVGYGEFLVEPGLIVGSWMTWFGPLYEGDRWDAIVGVVHFGYGEYKVEPRYYDDYLGYRTDVRRWHDLAPGDLVLTEIMVAPDACDDGRAEYVELANLSGVTIDLAGVTLVVDGQQLRFTERQLVGDGGIVLGAPSGDRCYGPVPHFSYGFELDDAGGQTYAIFGGTVVDAVDTRGWPITFPSGASLSLDPDAWSADGNDAMTAWCAASQADAELVGDDGFDYGSPGYPNATKCP